MSTTNIFGGSPAITGIMSIPKGSPNIITFSSRDGNQNIGRGFMINQYSIQWARAVQNLFPMNHNGRVVIAGFGNGGLTFSGIVGRAADFEKLVNEDQDICFARTCIIKANSGFRYCSEDGGETQKDGTANIVCSGLIATSITLGGTRDQGGVSMQTASLSFMITGFTISTDTD